MFSLYIYISKLTSLFWFSICPIQLRWQINVLIIEILKNCFANSNSIFQISYYIGNTNLFTVIIFLTLFCSYSTFSYGTNRILFCMSLIFFDFEFHYWLSSLPSFLAILFWIVNFHNWFYITITIATNFSYSSIINIKYSFNTSNSASY